jgi:hypothetical protein
MTPRLPDWETRLHDYIVAHEGAVFKWGHIDCALFAAGAVLAQTGDDFGAPFRGRYRSVAGSLRALKKWGAGDLVSTITAYLPQIETGFAKRGDLVMFGGSAGVCIGADGLFVGEENGEPGLVRIARGDWDRAWSVG